MEWYIDKWLHVLSIDSYSFLLWIKYVHVKVLFLFFQNKIKSSKMKLFYFRFFSINRWSVNTIDKSKIVTVSTTLLIFFTIRYIRSTFKPIILFFFTISAKWNGIFSYLQKSWLCVLKKKNCIVLQNFVGLSVLG